jgi:hypothetical protein
MITKTITVKTPRSEQEVINTIEVLRSKLEERGYDLIALHEPTESDKKLHDIKGSPTPKSKKRRRSIIAAFFQSYLACVLVLLGTLALVYYWR